MFMLEIVDTLNFVFRKYELYSIINAYSNIVLYMILGGGVYDNIAYITLETPLCCSVLHIITVYCSVLHCIPGILQPGIYYLVPVLVISVERDKAGQLSQTLS